MQLGTLALDESLAILLGQCVIYYPEIIGHRGVRGAAVPENSVAAFLEAIKQGAGGVELDARICATGEIVVFHDKKLKHLSNGRGRVKHTDFNVLRGFRLLQDGKTSGHIIPTLDEVFDAIQPLLKAQPDFLVNVEIKGKDSPQAIVDVIQKRLKKGVWKPQNITISHFHHKRLEVVKGQLPQIALGLLFAPRTRSPKKIYNMVMPLAEKWGAASINLPIQCYFKGNLASRLQAEGLIAVAWTMDEKPEHAEKYARIVAEQGINLITDYPREILKRIEKIKQPML